jgi:hypothetical protein
MVDKNKFVEEIERDCFVEDLSNQFNQETVEVIMEALEHPDTLHKLTSWEELGL